MILRRFRSFLTGTYPTRTGKRTKLKGYVSAFGETRGVLLHVYSDGTVLCTLQEMAQMAIQCAMCEQVIFPGDPVVLYSLKSGHEAPPYATSFMIDDEIYFIGCLLRKCAFGCMPYGHWIPDPEHPGRCTVKKHQTPMEILLKNPDANVIVINNIHDAYPDVSIF